MTKEEFKAMIIENYIKGKKIVFVNIGTEKYIGDSFAPLLGSMLQCKLDIIKIYGTLDETINGRNMIEELEHINKKYKNDFIIGVDAAFSDDYDNCNEDFIIRKESFKPGEGVGKNHLPHIGNACIKFCIRNDEEDHFDSLKKPNIKEIYNRTKKAADFIFEIDEELKALEVQYEDRDSHYTE
jgi:putative sporulation protein YyaC